MRIIDRHLTGLFLRQLALILAVLVGLYGLIEFIERVDNFIEGGAVLVHYLRYPLLKLPQMAAQTLPMAMLLATFTTIGQLSRTQQITALRSGGVSIWQTSRPLFVCGILFSLLMLVANGWLVPWSSRESRYLYTVEVGGNAAAVEVSRDLYLRDGQRILGVTEAFPQRGELRGVVLLELDQNFHLLRRLDAESGRYDQNHRWQLTTVTEHRFDPASQQVIGFDRMAQSLIDLGRDPEELRDTWGEPAELTFPQLIELIDRLRRDGQDPRRYHGELHFRIAQSLTPLIVVLIGAPFALQRGRQATLGVGITLCLGVFVSYMLLQAVGMALGSVSLLPIPLAAWSANLLLLLIGAWMFMRTEE